MCWGGENNKNTGHKLLRWRNNKNTGRELFGWGNNKNTGHQLLGWGNNKSTGQKLLNSGEYYGMADCRQVPIKHSRQFLLNRDVCL